MSADLDALMREPDDFEKRLFAIEKVLHLVEECRAAERGLIRDLARALAEEDEEYASRYRKMRPVDLSATLADAFQFLHDMHASYVTEREAAKAGRELYEREREHARAARSLLARGLFTRQRL